MTIKPLTCLILFLLAAVGLITIGASFFDQLACEGQLINNNVLPTHEQQIWGERLISQSFVAPYDSLSRIDILFQTYQRHNSHDVTLRLLAAPHEIANVLQGVEQFRTTFNASTVGDQMWRTFTFPPLADSAGKTYLISLYSPESTDGDAITVGGIERNAYIPGSAFLGPTPVPADITFRACFQLSIPEKLGVFSEQRPLILRFE
ncbi:MAG: hypothetical protein HYR94_06155 [Chloroflexi bacterium]|nr:hypothetical protein [Chloroflexota bacterium]